MCNLIFESVIENRACGNDGELREKAVSRAQARIREAVIRNKQDKLTALLHHINIDVVRASFFG